MAKEGSWTLSEEEKNSCNSKIYEVTNNYLRLMIYNEYVESQRKGFISIMNFINNRINDLIEQGRISDFIQMRARIKSAESALKNDEAKALDDIFGMEIITATEEEYDTIIRNLTPYMVKTKCKNHDKPNGYKAKHKYWTFKKDKLAYLEGDFDFENNIPMIEFQFKTSEVQISCNTGPANHEDYKGEKREDIQRKYDKGKFTVFNTPYMWITRFTQEGEKHFPDTRLLTEEETLKTIYPFLNTKPKRGINK